MNPLRYALVCTCIFKVVVRGMPPQFAMQLRETPPLHRGTPSDPWRVLHWRVTKQGSLLPMLVGVVLLPAAAAWAPAASLSARPQAFAASRRAVGAPSRTMQHALTLMAGAPFNQTKAVLAAGFAFEAYNEPSEQDARWERGADGCDVAFMSEDFAREVHGQQQHTTRGSGNASTRNKPNLTLTLALTLALALTLTLTRMTRSPNSNPNPSP